MNLREAADILTDSINNSIKECEEQIKLWQKKKDGSIILRNSVLTLVGEQERKFINAKKCKP